MFWLEINTDIEAVSDIGLEMTHFLQGFISCRDTPQGLRMTLICDVVAGSCPGPSIAMAAATAVWVAGNW
jgi:hypothetical protein